MPVHSDSRRVLLKAGVACPESWPFAPFAARDVWCQHNHSQSAERLAERGGLSPGEALAILEERRYHPSDFSAKEEPAVAKVAARLAQLADTERLPAGAPIEPPGDATGAAARAERALWEEALEQLAVGGTDEVRKAVAWVRERVGRRRGV